MRFGRLLRRLSLALTQRHVPGDAEQQDPAGDPQCIQRNTQVVEQRPSESCEDHQGDSRHQNRPSGDPPGPHTRVVSGQGDEHRRQARRIHDHQQRQERGECVLRHSDSTVTAVGTRR